MTINPEPMPNPEPVAAEFRKQLETVLLNGAAFREQVRDRAIQGYHDLDWSLDALNDTLRELGLEPHEPRTVAMADLSISAAIMADTDDEHIGTAAMRCLETPEGQQVLRTAINGALKTLNGTGPALSMFGGVLSVSIETASLQTA